MMKQYDVFLRKKFFMILTSSLFLGCNGNGFFGQASQQDQESQSTISASEPEMTEEEKLEIILDTTGDDIAFTIEVLVDNPSGDDEVDSKIMLMNDILQDEIDQSPDFFDRSLRDMIEDLYLDPYNLPELSEEELEEHEEFVETLFEFDYGLRLALQYDQATELGIGSVQKRLQSDYAAEAQSKADAGKENELRSYCGKLSGDFGQRAASAGTMKAAGNSLVRSSNNGSLDAESITNTINSDPTYNMGSLMFAQDMIAIEAITREQNTAGCGQ